MKVNWDDYSQYIWKIKHVPNHQPVIAMTVHGVYHRMPISKIWCLGIEWTQAWCLTNKYDDILRTLEICHEFYDQHIATHYSWLSPWYNHIQPCTVGTRPRTSWIQIDPRVSNGFTMGSPDSPQETSGSTSKIVTHFSLPNPKFGKNWKLTQGGWRSKHRIHPHLTSSKTCEITWNPHIFSMWGPQL